MHGGRDGPTHCIDMPLRIPGRSLRQLYPTSGGVPSAHYAMTGWCLLNRCETASHDNIGLYITGDAFGFLAYVNNGFLELGAIDGRLRSFTYLLY